MAKILVADDDLFYRRLITDWLHKMGHEVTSVTNGNDALREWQQSNPPFDCIVVDVFMDGMSGPELLEKIQEIVIAEDNRKRRLKAIAMTSDESIGTEIAVRQVQAISLLIKPFAEERFAEVINATLHGRRQSVKR